MAVGNETEGPGLLYHSTDKSSGEYIEVRGWNLRLIQGQQFSVDFPGECDVIKRLCCNMMVFSH